MADFDPPWANDGTRRAPTTIEQSLGFQCGPADPDLFNFLFHRLQSEVNGVLVGAGLSPSDSDLTQLLQAIDARVLRGRSHPGKLDVQSARTLLPAEAGRYVQLGGASSFTVTLPDPDDVDGSSFYFYNAGSTDKTLATPEGVFLGSKGSGEATHVIPRGASAWLVSAYDNWVVMYQSWSILAVSGAITLKPNALGGYVQLSGSSTYTVTLPDPTAVSGAELTIFNAAASTAHTLSTPTGSIVGPGGSGAATKSLAAGAATILRAGYLNWIAIV